MVENPTSFGWQLFGTLLCGLVFTIPIIIGFYFYKWVKGVIEKRKTIQEAEETVI